MVAGGKPNHGPVSAFVRDVERPAELGRDRLSNRDRHNPLGFAPSTDDVIALRLELSGFSNPQTLSHAAPTFDSQSGTSNRETRRLQENERDLIWVKFL